MDNLSEIPGRQQVIIENVSAESLKVNVNGEIKEIRNGLEELKLLLKNLNAENFKSGDKIYNIGTISNAVFSAEIGKKTFNMYLCRKLTESLRNHHPGAKEFLDNMKEVDRADWETQSRYTRKANGFIISGFVGVLGILLQKVISAGKDAAVSNNPKDYLEVCIATAQRTLQLICFSFISKIWDHKKDDKCEFTRKQLDALSDFFDTDIELNIADYVNLLKSLAGIFDEHRITFPFAEFDKEIILDESNFIKACKNLKEINDQLDAGGFTLTTAFQAENELTTFLTALNFLAAYKMVAIKDISYKSIRNNDAQYLHSYTFLGVDAEDKLNSSKYKYDTKPISSDAVIIYKNKYQEGLNLFPFIIDLNSLTGEMEVKICFYTYFEAGRKKLTYSDINKISLEKTGSSMDITDPCLVTIVYNEDLETDMKSGADNDITRLKGDVKKYNTMQLNTVYKIFQNAKEVILN
jgi:hypothetical protein